MHERVSDQVAGGAVKHDAAGLQHVRCVGGAQRFADILLDEPSLGIAPKLIPQIYAGIRAIAATGTTVLLVEQNVREALRAADTAYVLQTGRVVLSGSANDLIGDPLVQEAFLGIGAA